MLLTEPSDTPVGIIILYHSQVYGTLQVTQPVVLLCFLPQAESNTNRLKAVGSMMAAVACASMPKITVVIGGCHGADSYAMVCRMWGSLLYLQCKYTYWLQMTFLTIMCLYWLALLKEKWRL